MGFAGLRAQLRVAPVADVFLIVFGNAEQHADDFHRHDRAEIFDEVESTRSNQWVQGLSAELVNHRPQRPDPARREHARQQLAVHVVNRRVFEDQHPRRDFEVGLDQLQDHAPRGAERGVVDQRLGHIGEPAQREEVVFRVVVKRRLVTQAREHRIRVGDELDIVWIEMNIAIGARRHEIPPATAISGSCLRGQFVHSA
jgi:hypothetical protein